MYSLRLSYPTILASVVNFGRRGRFLRGTVISLVVLAVVCVVAVGGFVVWAQSPHSADPEALAQANESPGVRIDVAPDVVVVEPTEAEPDTGIVFYPGGRVEPEAYAASWAPIVAEGGVRVLIPSMPLNLAVFDTDRADDTVAEHGGDVENWYVGGHSLGGSMAAGHIGDAPEIDVVGLVLWGSYATESAGLAQRDDLHVLSVSAAQDGLSDPVTTAENRKNLPAEAVTHEIAGMNHAQFGAYGDQRGDGTARIGEAEARERLAETMLDFLDSAPEG